MERQGKQESTEIIDLYRLDLTQAELIIVYAGISVLTQIIICNTIGLATVFKAARVLYKGDTFGQADFNSLNDKLNHYKLIINQKLEKMDERDGGVQL